MESPHIQQLSNRTSEILSVSSLILFCKTVGSTESSTEGDGTWYQVSMSEVSCGSPVGDSAPVLPSGDIPVFSAAMSAVNWSIFSLRAKKQPFDRTRTRYRNGGGGRTYGQLHLWVRNVRTQTQRRIKTEPPNLANFALPRGEKVKGQG